MQMSLLVCKNTRNFHSQVFSFHGTTRIHQPLVVYVPPGGQKNQDHHADARQNNGSHQKFPEFEVKGTIFQGPKDQQHLGTHPQNWDRDSFGVKYCSWIFNSDPG